MSKDEQKVDGAGELADAIKKASRTLAHAITPTDNVGSEDAGGVYVSSLTEAVIGLTKAMHDIAGAIAEVAESIEYVGSAISDMDATEEGG